jgi:CheY-like chemotaxis protein
VRWQQSHIHGNPSTQQPEVASKEQKHSTNPSEASSPRILIAEDDKALRELMAHLLAFEGYFITEAADAHAMLQAVRASGNSGNDTFDLIVTDVRMPGQTGLDALASLRKSGYRTPAIIVSALPGEMVQVEAEQLDALFLPKPFALENLRRIANRVVSGFQSQNLSTI